MWSYDDVDRWVTLKQLAVISKWFEEKHPMDRSRNLMVSLIERDGNEFKVHLCNAGDGYIQKLKIVDGKVIDLKTDGFWMS